jgi:hypothetical protein
MLCLRTHLVRGNIYSEHCKSLSSLPCIPVHHALGPTTTDISDGVPLTIVSLSPSLSLSLLRWKLMLPKNLKGAYAA